jgi:hypothetical protein
MDNNLGDIEVEVKGVVYTISNMSAWDSMFLSWELFKIATKVLGKAIRNFDDLVTTFKNEISKETFDISGAIDKFFEALDPESFIKIAKRCMHQVTAPKAGQFTMKEPAKFNMYFKGKLDVVYVLVSNVLKNEYGHFFAEGSALRGALSFLNKKQAKQDQLKDSTQEK